MPTPAARSSSLSPSPSPARCSRAPRGAGSSPARMRMRMVGAQVGSAPLGAEGALGVTGSWARGHCWVGVVLSLAALPHPWGAQPSPLSLHPQAPSPQPLQPPALRRMRRMKIHSPGGGGSASAAWRRRMKRMRRRIEGLPLLCLCPGPVLFSGLFADFIGFLQVFCSFSGVSTGFLGFLQIFFCRF